MPQAWKLPSGKVLRRSHVVWRCSPLLMGHNWLNCADWRGSCAILGGVMDHERLLKCSVVHSLIPFIMKLPTSGEEFGHSHLNLSIYNCGTLEFCELFLFLTDKTSAITSANGYWNCNDQALLWGPWVVISSYSLPSLFFLSVIFMFWYYYITTYNNNLNSYICTPHFNQTVLK